MAEPIKWSRRSWTFVSIGASSAVPLRAQQPPAAAPPKEEDDLERARQNIRRSSEQLKRYKLDTLTEPAFQFLP